MAIRTRIVPSLLVLATLLFAACGSSEDGPSCDRLADHEAALILAALPTDMQEPARRGMAEQRDKLLAACERDRPGSARARCELAATDLAAHRRCGTDATNGETR